MIARLFLIAALLHFSHQTEVYATDTNGYVDQTAWKEELRADQFVGEEEYIMREPKIVEERVTAPPRVLTQKVTTEPKIIEESIVAPIKQKIITQPTILNKKIVAQPQFIYGQNEVVEKPTVFLPAEVSHQKVEKKVEIPGQKIEYNTYVQPTEHTIYEKININEGRVKKQELTPIYNQVHRENVVVPKVVEVPGANIY